MVGARHKTMLFVAHCAEFPNCFDNCSRVDGPNCHSRQQLAVSCTGNHLFIVSLRRAGRRAHSARRPSRRAILLIGDGAAQTTIQELGTFVRLGLKPLVIVLNNDGYTIERALHNPRAKYHDVARWNWSKLATAFGAGADGFILEAQTNSALEDALRAASAEPRMVILEVKLDANDRPEFMDRFVAAISKRNAA